MIATTVLAMNAGVPPEARVFHSHTLGGAYCIQSSALHIDEEYGMRIFDYETCVQAEKIQATFFLSESGIQKTWLLTVITNNKHWLRDYIYLHDRFHLSACRPGRLISMS